MAVGQDPVHGPSGRIFRLILPKGDLQPAVLPARLPQKPSITLDGIQIKGPLQMDIAAPAWGSAGSALPSGRSLGTLPPLEVLPPGIEHGGRAYR